MRMNHPDGKRLLATVRGGDYAHAGEEEAIHLLWERLPKIPTQACLDAGCGRGGTAAFVQSHDWGSVTGVDIDATSICGGLCEASRTAIFTPSTSSKPDSAFPGQFDIIYAFNAFYAFPDQPAALAALAGAAQTGSRAVYSSTMSIAEAFSTTRLHASRSLLSGSQLTSPASPPA